MTTPTEHTVRGLPLPPDLRTVEIDGARLAYREHGTGQPVIFVHGSISDLTTWDAQLPAIGTRYRAIAYSRRYAWPNDDLPPGERDMIGRHVADLLAFLHATGASPAHLVGNSWGALICLMAAIREPAAVRSLVLEEPPLIPLIAGAHPAPRRILASLLRHPLVTLPVMRFASTTLRRVGELVDAGAVEDSVEPFARAVLGDDVFEELPDEVRHHMVANAGTHVGQFRADGGFEPVTAAQVRAVSAPALVVTGAHSPAFLRKLAGLLAKLLPHARSADIPAASHGMHFENPAALNAELLRFLGEATPA